MRRQKKLVGELPPGWKPARANFDDVDDNHLWEGDLHEENNIAMQGKRSLVRNTFARPIARPSTGSGLCGSRSRVTLRIGERPPRVLSAAVSRTSERPPLYISPMSPQSLQSWDVRSTDRISPDSTTIFSPSWQVGRMEHTLKDAVAALHSVGRSYPVSITDSKNGAEVDRTQTPQHKERILRLLERSPKSERRGQVVGREQPQPRWISMDAADSPAGRLGSTATSVDVDPEDLDGLWGFEIEEACRSAAKREKCSIAEGPQQKLQNSDVATYHPAKKTDLGSGSLRKKILQLEAAAPSEMPEIIVEFCGSMDGGKSLNEELLSFRKHMNALQKEGLVAKGRRRGQSLTEALGQTLSFGRDEITAESLTAMPPQDLHLYQKYCAETNSLLIFRPISAAVPDMYAGTFSLPKEYCGSDGIPLTLDEIHRRISPNMTLEDLDKVTVRQVRVRGKGINISLKSSPYRPIEGLIPTNPALSKTWQTAAGRQRMLEDLLLTSELPVTPQSRSKKKLSLNVAAIQSEEQFLSDTSVPSPRASPRGMRQRRSSMVAIYREMRQQQSSYGDSTSTAVNEIKEKLAESRQRLSNLLRDYHEESIMSTDKLSVSLRYIDVLNESQFLGTTTACWRGMDVYYREGQSGDDVMRNPDGEPQFFIVRGNKRTGLVAHVYQPKTNELDERGIRVTPALRLRPVEVVTHLSFIICESSKRIEPDPLGDFVIAPDFDGLAYAQRLPAKTTVQQYVKLCERRLRLRPVDSYGIVSDLDVSHVREMRQLSKWKQNHGYECSNTKATQELGPGSYICVTPTDVSIAKDFFQIIDYYRVSWVDGFPLLLNPNWKVVLSQEDGLPVPYGDEPYALPIAENSEMTRVKSQIVEAGLWPKMKELQEEAGKYEAAVLQQGLRSGKRQRRIGFPMSSLVIPDLALALAKKRLVEAFWEVRRWMLLPPLFTAERRLPAFLRAQGPPPLSEEFEAYRWQRIDERLGPFEKALAKFNVAFPQDGGEFSSMLFKYLAPDTDIMRTTAMGMSCSKPVEKVALSRLDVVEAAAENPGDDFFV